MWRARGGWRAGPQVQGGLTEAGLRAGQESLEAGGEGLPGPARDSVHASPPATLQAPRAQGDDTEVTELDIKGCTRQAEERGAE